MSDQYYSDANAVKPVEMPTMAESKVEEVRSVLLRIERLLRPVLSQPVNGLLSASSSNPTPVKQSKLLKDLDDVLQYASDLESRITL